MEPDEESLPESLPGELLQDRHAATAPNRGKRCQCGKEPNEESVPESLPGELLLDGLAATAPNRGKRCQCGMEPDEESLPETPVDRATGRRTCRNGTESRETLPVWNEVWLGNGQGTACKR